MWLRAARANRKLKRNARTKDADGIQASSLLYETQFEAISQHKYILWEEGGGDSQPSARYASAEAPTTRHATF